MSDSTLTTPIGFSETPSGILMPTEEPKREAWLKEDSKFLRRLVRWTESKQLVIPTFVCAKCKEPVIGYDKPNHIVWECGCTAREMEKT